MDAKAAETERRKEEHLRIPLEKDVQSIPNPWDAVRLLHNALPELNKDQVDLTTMFLGRKLQAPIQITGMTGGAQKARDFNDALAAAAAKHGVAMGVGSQRAALENPKLADTYSVILDHKVPMRMANLGLPQIILWGEGQLRVYENPAPNPRPDRPRLWQNDHYRRSKITWNYYSP